jgi:hypothetical protein
MSRKHIHITGVIFPTILLLLLIPSIYSLENKNSGNGSIYRELGMRYITSEFPNESITIILEETYVHPETKIEYTILRGKHNDEPFEATFSHLDKTFTLGTDKIKSDLNDFLETLPEPYRKMDSDLRLKIRDEYGFHPSLNDPAVSDKSFLVVFLVNNTRDLVETAKFVNSISGFPDVWNGRRKYVAKDMKLREILKVTNLIVY